MLAARSSGKSLASVSTEADTPISTGRLSARWSPIPAGPSRAVPRVSRITLHWGAMPTRNHLNGVLGGFLGTYTSRYSDFDGYWLFGFLLGSAEPLELDLLGTTEPWASPEPGFRPTNGTTMQSGIQALGVACKVARVKLAEQLAKHGLPLSIVREARLSIEREAERFECPTGWPSRSGFDVRFRATLVADSGRRFERETVVFVAPHDPRLESRSARVPTGI